MRTSDLAMLKEHKDLLTIVARTLVDLYDADRDGDDYWHSIELPNGAPVDINIWIDGDDRRTTLKVSAYGVNEYGMDTDSILPLITQRITIHQQQRRTR